MYRNILEWPKKKLWTKERSENMKVNKKEKSCDKPVRTTFGGIRQRKIVRTFIVSSVFYSSNLLNLG